MTGSNSLPNILKEVDELINSTTVLNTLLIESELIAGYHVGHGIVPNSDPAYVSTNSFSEDGTYYARQIWYDRKTRRMAFSEPQIKGFELKQAAGRQKNGLYAFEVELKHRRVAKMTITKLLKLESNIVGLLLNVHEGQKKVNK